MSPAYKTVSIKPSIDGSECKAMNDILSRIGDKWSVRVVSCLKSEPVRFNQLRRDIGSISQRMLTRTLRNLERDGLVTRTLYAEVPPRVEYELTPVGRTLLPVIEALWDWAMSHRDEVISAREQYDSHNGKILSDAAE